MKNRMIHLEIIRWRILTLMVSTMSITKFIIVVTHQVFSGLYLEWARVENSYGSWNLSYIKLSLTRKHKHKDKHKQWEWKTVTKVETSPLHKALLSLAAEALLRLWQKIYVNKHWTRHMWRLRNLRLKQLKYLQSINLLFSVFRVVSAGGQDEYVKLMQRIFYD